MSRQKSRSPAQQGRNRVADAVRKRGQSPYNLWLLQPPLQSDSILVNSDAKMELFYFLEGATEVEEVDYTPLKEDEKSGNSVPGGFEHFANILSRGVRRKVLWTGASTSALGRPEDLQIGFPDLDANKMRVDNWRRVIPCIRRVKLHETNSVERQLSEWFPRNGASLQQLLDAHGSVPQGVLLGVVGLLVRKRHWVSDLDSSPWSLHTRLRKKENV